ncbi:hypothetical protein NPIL_595291 [Nephila pilipes]|uniref:Secreted protein n=1 Tax=Nephila pilipes TaxID=299642 RepID=A0A8X6T9V3_NEPPI|nr:hypothetical protein NPIL_595291 [Nephila pilipes]
MKSAIRSHLLRLLLGLWWRPLRTHVVHRFSSRRVTRSTTRSVQEICDVRRRPVRRRGGSYIPSLHAGVPRGYRGPDRRREGPQGACTERRGGGRSCG